jgi:hypothetical protein
MLHTVAIRGYRSLREIVLPLARLTVVTGANGTASPRCLTSSGGMSPPDSNPLCGLEQ